MINIDYVCASSVTIEKTRYYAQNPLPVSHLPSRQTGASVIPGNKRRKRDKEREGRRRQVVLVTRRSSASKPVDLCGSK